MAQRLQHVSARGGIRDNRRKRALLLYQAGSHVREIFAQRLDKGEDEDDSSLRKSERLISSSRPRMFYHQSAAATRRSYQTSLTWLWLTRARVTDSNQTVQRGI